MLFFENSRGTVASFALAAFLLATFSLACFFGAAFGLLGGFLRALLGLGRALLLAGSLLRGGLLRRDLRALFRNGGGFGGRWWLLRSSWWCLSFRRLIRA